jgi:Na+-transporting methylmalonyl-CoA/oxaloacetate decarboxylase gamma subunit
MSFGGAGFVALLFLILAIAIMVAISRWVFRINDIVERLDSIIALLRKAQERTL